MTQIRTMIGDEPTQAQSLPHAPTPAIPKSNLWDAIQYLEAVLSSADGLLSARVTTAENDIASLQANKQPLDADLTAIAALTTAAYGRSLLELANAAALRTLAGLGTIATQNANGVAVTGGSITGMPDPTNASDVATKGWVEALVAVGVKRGTVRAATTGNVTISTALNSGDSIDGVTLANGDLVLVNAQSTASQNGIYVVGVTPVRSPEFDTYNEHPGALIVVQEGSTYADTAWLCTSNAGGTLNTTGITFNQLALAGALLASNNLSDLANTATARTNLGVGTGNSPQFTGLELGHASDTTVTRTGPGAIAVEGVGVALNSASLPHTVSQLELGHASDTTFARTAAGRASIEGNPILLNNTENQGPLTGGANVTPKDLGTITTGTVTVDVGDRIMQSYINNGAHALAVDTGGTGTAILLITNAASAGAITTSAFDRVLGDPFDTTNGSTFNCVIYRWGASNEILIVQKLG